MNIDGHILKKLESAINQAAYVFIKDPSLVIKTTFVGIENLCLSFVNTVGYDDILKVKGASDFLIDFIGYEFAASELRSNGEHLLFPIRSSKSSERVLGSIENGECTFLNPYDQLTQLIKPVAGFSNSYLTLENPTRSELWKKGLTISGMQVKSKDKVVGEVSGEVHSIWPMYRKGMPDAFLCQIKLK